MTVKKWWQRYLALVRWSIWCWRQGRRAAEPSPRRHRPTYAADGAHEVPQGVESIGRASGTAIFVRADVGAMDEVREMMGAAVRQYGRMDVIHSNAAAYALGSATEIDEAALDRTLAVCLKATWMIAHCAVPAMLAQGGGTLVITGTVHAIRGYAGHAAYQAAKGGLLALTRSLAADYAPAIRVNAILPGAVETGLWDGISTRERERIAQMCPLRRNGRPEDIAQAALFLASDMSAYMTGTYLVVDGGPHIHHPEVLRPPSTAQLRREMKIRAIETIQDPRHPLLLWVHVHTDDGVIGLGETFQIPGAVARVMHTSLVPILLGQDPTQIELLWHHMFRALHYAGYAGAEMRALTAIDIALWDILGKVTNRPVYSLLGGACRDRIPTYNTCAGYGAYDDHTLSFENPGQLAKDLLAMGIRAMKIWPFDDLAVPSLGQRITHEQVEYGVARFRAIRDAVGDAMEVALEGHCQWNLPSAIRIAQAVEPYHPLWLEELMLPDDPRATRELRAATRTPLVTSERLMTRWGFGPVLEQQAADIVMLDIAWTGGFTEARKVAALAESHQLPVAPHNPGGPVSNIATAHFCASVYNLFIMESVRAYYLTWFNEILTYNHVPVDGAFPLPPGPGLGTELHPDFLARSDLVRELARQSTTFLTGHALGNPYTTGNPW